MNQWLNSRGEYFLAGFIEEPELPLIRRMGRGLRKQLELCALPVWNGEDLFPTGAYSIWEQGAVFSFNYSFPLPFQFNQQLWEERIRGCEDENVYQELTALGKTLAEIPKIPDALPEEFWLGGCGYTHSIVNYNRVVNEGLESYALRVAEALGRAQQVDDHESINLYTALADVLGGIKSYHGRMVGYLESLAASDAQEQLLTALRQVPWHPARNFYEGLVAVNFTFFLDGCDSLGRFDQVLGVLYERDLQSGWLNEQKGEALVRGLWRNMDQNSGWNTALGGSTAGGAPAYNRLTLACLRAAKKMRRPNLALRIRRDMPEDAWDAALDTIASGCGLPALYNEETYLEALNQPGLVPDLVDRVDFAFGGCTETMVHGKSNVGSLDAGINLLQILSRTLRRALPGAPDFDSLIDDYKRDVSGEIARLTAAVSRQQKLKADIYPQLIRTLLIDDCIDQGIEYNAGGARYNWSVINVGGLSNMVDSLEAVRELVFERKEINSSALMDALERNFDGDSSLKKRLSTCARFGNDDPRVDGLAAELSEFVFAEFKRYTPWRGGQFLPGCLMFVTYADAGYKVGATPDGRAASAPIADSMGPVAGRDTSGPTAMMRSVACLDWKNAPGTLVVNLRLHPTMFTGREERLKVKALIKAYFGLGNMQVQINVIDQETLKKAIAAPEEYQDLIVRIGGYSEYFHRLSPDLRQTVLERTIHGG